MLYFQNLLFVEWSLFSRAENKMKGSNCVERCGLSLVITLLVSGILERSLAMAKLVQSQSMFNPRQGCNQG